jgi:hypothetical protein
MTLIELDDDLAAALKAKADAQHLKLEDWFRTLTGMPAKNGDSQRRQGAAARRDGPFKTISTVTVPNEPYCHRRIDSGQLVL